MPRPPGPTPSPSASSPCWPRSQADEGLTQTGLVKATGIDRSTLAELVARMIAKGLLERERSSVDARANAVHLTDAGRAALEAAGPRAQAADEALLKLLPSGKRDGFLGRARPAMAGGDRRKAGAPEKDVARRRRRPGRRSPRRPGRRPRRPPARTGAGGGLTAGDMYRRVRVPFSSTDAC